MGLYDWVYVKCKCPNCGQMRIRQFQTKDLGCGFDEFEFGDEVCVENNHIKFIDICDKCHCTIEAFGLMEDNKLIGIEIYRYYPLFKDYKKIYSSYHWDRDNQKIIKTIKRRHINMAKRKPTAWNKHVSATKKKNPKMAFSAVLKTAKKTYKK